MYSTDENNVIIFLSICESSKTFYIFFLLSFNDCNLHIVIGIVKILFYTILN